MSKTDVPAYCGVEAINPLMPDGLKEIEKVISKRLMDGYILHSSHLLNDGKLMMIFIEKVFTKS